MATISEEVKALLAEAFKLDEQKKILKKEVKVLEDRISTFNVRIDQISVRVHNEIIMEDDLDTESFAIKLAELGAVELEIKPRFNVTAVNKILLVQELKANEDTQHLVKEDVHNKTLESYCKEALRSNGEYPYPDYITVFNQPSLKFKKG